MPIIQYSMHDLNKTSPERYSTSLYRKEFILHRYEGNPIITPKDFPDADAIYNCGQVMFEGQTLLLLSVAPRHGTPALHVALSRDGYHFEIEKEPFISRLEDPLWHELDIWPIDPRVTQIGDEYYIVRPLSGPLQPAAVLERTKDWKTREFIECIALPPNRVPCLFPEKIGGSYMRLDRPSNGPRGEIWLSSSPALIHWGKHRRVVAPPINHVWAVEKIGPTPPIKTKHGWLEIFHGVLTYAGGARYSLGAMLLDLHDPQRVLGVAQGWILTPDAPYEFMGNCQNTVFTCGAIADESIDEIRVYYGAADTCIGLATGSLNELISCCLSGKP